jgi:hypothetical protein
MEFLMQLLACFRVDPYGILHGDQLPSDGESDQYPAEPEGAD